ncbi:MAG: hypothetical protein Kow00121_68760 [Elainellaceae cyanobacterium]
MTDASLLSLAKQGNSQAIAALINQQLQPQGITAKTALKGKHLQILLIADQVPKQSSLVHFIHGGITKLACPSIEWVKVYGLQKGDQTPVWSQVLAIASPEKSGLNQSLLVPAAEVKVAAQQVDKIPVATASLQQQAISKTAFVTDQLPASDAQKSPNTELPNGETSEDRSLEDENLNDQLNEQLLDVDQPSSESDQAEHLTDELQTDIEGKPQRPATYKTPSILLTLFSLPVILTLPFGIIALIFASQAASKHQQADYQGAKVAAKTAKKLCIIGTCVTLPTYLLAIAGFSHYWMQFQAEQKRAAEADAASYISSFNVNQMVYQAEHNRFASSFEDLNTYSLYAQDDINSTKTDRYDYSILVADETKVVVTAAAQEAELSSFTGSVHVMPDGKIEVITCQTNAASQTPPEAPVLIEGRLQCPAEASPYAAKKSKGDSAV